MSLLGPVLLETNKDSIFIGPRLLAVGMGSEKTLSTCFHVQVLTLQLSPLEALEALEALK